MRPTQLRPEPYLHSEVNNLRDTLHKSQIFITENLELVDPAILQSGSVLVCKTLLVDMRIIV